MWRFKDKTLLMGTQGATLAVAHAIYALDVEFSIEHESENERPASNYSGAELQTFYGHHVSLNFKTPLAVSGVAGTAPVTSPLWLACGFAQVSDATKVVYSRGAATPAVASFIFGKHTHAITGLKGNFSLAFEKGRPMIQWQFKGVFSAPTASGAALQPNWDSWKKPDVLGPEYGSSFKLNNIAMTLHKLSVDAGNKVIYDRTITSSAIEITGHESKGQLTVTATELATFNPFTMAGEVVPFEFKHGMVAGKKITISGRLQLPVPKYANLSSELTGYELEGNLIPLVGNDELKITFE